MKREISVGILAGGKSSRMGHNKAYLPIGNESFLEHTVRICSGYKDLWISVDDPEKYPGLPYSLAVDEKKDYGPVEGIYQLLRHVKNSYCIILATDMPLLKPSLLQAMEQRLSGMEDCLILTSEGRIHPLCGIYKKTLLPAFEEMRKKEIHKIRLLFDHVKTVYVDLEDLGFSEKYLDNINTQQEYESLRKRECE
ncbi:molybdenum cofactor guanylyltransferase [Novisyntrophococcus fermenticellae]|uniref:molybdenum cofactor guanylyltransferase n=1 Tax=Novisyntrophococcus fermenticellae TaxID=2068655 RepID=UPI001E347770|nr:molybdenum cofactor guanylyltransferase [Novisyntrophococcus fermenticellae]